MKQVKAKDFVTETIGQFTIEDILKELEKPGRDPRSVIEEFRFADGVSTMADLKPGMKIPGIITNITNFGAFVDVGVHQDGLVHISALSHTFVKDPHDVVKAGDIVSVKVMEVDIQRKRIGLTMRLDDQPGDKADETAAGPRSGRSNQNQARKPSQNKANQGARTQQKSNSQNNKPQLGSMGALLQQALSKKK